MSDQWRHSASGAAMVSTLYSYSHMASPRQLNYGQTNYAQIICQQTI